MFEGLTLKNWRWQLSENGILQLLMDTENGSANTFSRAAMRELGAIVERLAIEPPKGVLFLSGKSSGFIAGADLTEFEGISDGGAVLNAVTFGQKVFSALERLPCPTVAAIDGFCMGGGTELALACSHRVATDSGSTRIGLPEIKLGLHPGWGGTVRLPKLVGAPAAMDMILTGRGLKAKHARKIGLLDRVVTPEQLVPAAEKMIINRVPRRKPSVKARLSNELVARQALAPMLRKQVAGKANPKHYPAPFAVIKNWQKFGTKGAKAMRAEAKSFAKLATTDTARNLLRVFFLTERVKALAGNKSADIQHVHVIGAGVMGGDIAAWCAHKGLTVTLQDREEQYIRPALERAEKFFEKKYRDDVGKIAKTKLRLTADVAGDGVAKADLIIEAIFENLQAKHELYQRVEPKMKDGAILATNTSSIPLQELATVLEDRGRFVGLHFFNPVAKMPLLEIVTHKKLRKAVLTRAAGFAKLIDRFGVPATSTPGFLVNRVLMPYQLEAMMMFSEGIPGPVIDKAAKRFGMPMGPIELADQVGLDVAASVAEVLSEHLGFEVNDQLRSMLQSKLDAGHRGKKDGKGFYDYDENGKQVKPQVDADYQAPSDIEDRLVLAYLNEAVACLREKVVADPELLDAGMIFGTGFAPFRGGPWQHIIDTGADQLKDRLEELSNKYGPRFTPDAGWDELIVDQAKAA